MNVRSPLITCATIAVFITLVVSPALAVIDLPRGSNPLFRWDPAPGIVNGYKVYVVCNGGGAELQGFTFHNTSYIYPRFCDTVAVRVAAVRFGADGGEGPLSEPSETIRFVDEEAAEGSAPPEETGNPGETAPPAGSTSAGVPLDFDGDGASDILVQNAETGELELWGLEGNQVVTVGTLPPLAAEARVVGNGDMNGDGSIDLLYLNSESGELGVWLIAGGAVIGGGVIAELAQDWDVVGNSDHDGDGRADVLLQQLTTGELELWTMDGPEILEAGLLSHARAAAGWEVAATGDYDGDGRADLLWYEPDAGQIDIWLMNERTLAANHVIGTGLDSSWEIVAAGDFDLDGYGDIVWRSKKTGATGIWFLEAGGLRGRSPLDVKARPIESVVGAADYDGDGLLDLLVRRGGRRPMLRALFMNGGEVLDEVKIGDLLSPWFVAGVGERSPTR